MSAWMARAPSSARPAIIKVCSKVPGASTESRRSRGLCRSASSINRARVTRPKKVSTSGASSRPAISSPPSSRASLMRSTWATAPGPCSPHCSSNHCSSSPAPGSSTASCSSSARLRCRPAARAARLPTAAATSSRTPIRAVIGIGHRKLAAASQAKPQGVPRPWASSSAGGTSSTSGLASGPSHSAKPCTTSRAPRASSACRGSRQARQRRSTSTSTPAMASASTK